MSSGVRMTLLLRLVISFAAVILVFGGVSSVNLLAMASLRADDARVSERLAVIDALRETEIRLTAQESVLDAYIASADEGLKSAFLGAARESVDASVGRISAAVSPQDLRSLLDSIAAWRQAAEVDMLVFQRQKPTQEARTAVHGHLGRIAAAERQAIGSAQQQKEATAITVKRVGWGGMLAAVLVGCLAAFWLLRTVQRPILQLTTVVEALARGEFAEPVPATGRGDEVGTIARAIAAFEQSMQETERLRAEQERLKEQAEAEKRMMLNRMAEEFEASVKDIVHLVAAAATELQSTARSMSEIAEGTNRQAACAETASGQAVASSRVVANSADALRLSIGAIRGQIGGTVAIANEAVAEVEETRRQIAALADATGSVGSVVKLISQITKQTNTLALNATIEAARAGDYGKGFAVVAAEVRALADQIARATTDISLRISGMRTTTDQSVGAIKRIAETIGRMSAIADAVADAVHEQGAATDRISDSVRQAAISTQGVTTSIVEVTRAADETRIAAGQVLIASDDLSKHSELLLAEVDRFVSRVRGERSPERPRAA